MSKVQPFCLYWRLVAGGWWLEVGAGVGGRRLEAGWSVYVPSMCGFIVKRLFFKL